jgi:hypothetical protein
MRGRLADLRRIAPEVVVAVPFDQVEGSWRGGNGRDQTTQRRFHRKATASPSIMQERERKRANVSTISGKR